MKDSWNINNVCWCSGEIQQELEKVEALGRKMAKQYLRNKLIFLALTVVILTGCILYMETLPALLTEFALLVILTVFLRKAGQAAQAPMYQMCDPYLEFAYIRAYSNLPFPRGKGTINRQILSLAQCMTLAGQPEAALTIQGQLDEPDRLKIGERCIYYNTQSLCYRQLGLMDKNRELMDELTERKKTAGRAEAIRLEMIIRMEEMKRHQEMGDIDYVEEYFRKYPPAYRFQAVGMHSNLAMLYIKAGRADLAKPHVEYVLDNGNKLFYKKELERYLLNSLEEEE